MRLRDITKIPGAAKLTPVIGDEYPSYLLLVFYKQWLRGYLPVSGEAALIQIWHGAGTRAARVTASSASTARRWCAARWAFGGHGKHRELWRELLAVTLGAFRFLAAVNDRLKFMIALLADVFKNRHEKLLRLAWRNAISI